MVRNCWLLTNMYMWQITDQSSAQKGHLIMFKKLIVETETFKFVHENQNGLNTIGGD
jgi:hypothetical protein